MARNKKNTSTGLRWVCAECANNDERKVVASITAQFAGYCKLRGERITPGQTVFALDSGERKTKANTQKAPPPQPALLPMDLKEAVYEYERWMAGQGPLSSGCAMRVLDAARAQLKTERSP